jgi:hypothetical protein
VSGGQPVPVQLSLVVVPLVHQLKTHKV